MRSLIQKKIIKVVLAILIAASAAFALALSASPNNAPLPEFDSSIETRVMGRFAGEFTAEDIEKLDTLTMQVGKLIYDVGEDYNPENVSNYLMHTSARELQVMAEHRGVSSSMTRHKVLDIVMDDPDKGDALVCYLLDFENSDSPRGSYYSIAVIHFMRTSGGLIASGITYRDSASAEDFEVIRDGITDRIRFNPVD